MLSALDAGALVRTCAAGDPSRCQSSARASRGAPCSGNFAAGAPCASPQSVPHAAEAAASVLRRGGLYPRSPRPPTAARPVRAATAPSPSALRLRRARRPGARRSGPDDPEPDDPEPDAPHPSDDPEPDGPDAATTRRTAEADRTATARTDGARRTPTRPRTRTATMDPRDREAGLHRGGGTPRPAIVVVPARRTASHVLLKAGHYTAEVPGVLTLTWELTNIFEISALPLRQRLPSDAAARAARRAPAPTRHAGRAGRLGPRRRPTFREAPRGRLAAPTPPLRHVAHTAAQLDEYAALPPPARAVGPMRRGVRKGISFRSKRPSKRARCPSADDGLIGPLEELRGSLRALTPRARAQHWLHGFRGFYRSCRVPAAYYGPRGAGGRRPRRRGRGAPRTARRGRVGGRAERNRRSPRGRAGKAWANPSR